MILKYLPNLLTAVRLIIIPFFVHFFINENLVVCTVLFAISGVSDAVDGFVARKFGCESNVGRILDPIADKLSYAAVFFTLFSKERIPTFFVIGFIILQLLHGAGATFIYRSKNTVVKSNIIGKFAGFSMFVLCFISLAWYDTLNEKLINIISFVVLLVIAAATVGYFIEYLIRPATKARKNNPIDN